MYKSWTAVCLLDSSLEKKMGSEGFILEEVEESILSYL